MLVEIIIERSGTMADLEALEREIRSSPAAETLKNAADSPEGRRVLEKLDTAKDFGYIAPPCHAYTP